MCVSVCVCELQRGDCRSFLHVPSPHQWRGTQKLIWVACYITIKRVITCWVLPEYLICFVFFVAFNLCLCRVAFRHKIKALLSSLLAGSGVSLVRKGGGGASGVRQPGPAADRRPMPRYFGTSGQRSGRQLLTHTHTHWDPQLLAPSKCFRVFHLRSSLNDLKRVGWRTRYSHDLGGYMS